MQQIFGEDTIVSLDIFHAIQRVTRKMSKRHPFFFECMNDFKMVFRSPTDIGKKRRQKTPCSAVTMERLEDFIKKWKRCELNGWRVLNDNALKEITSLRVHIRRGCLANIDPSAGTNRNKNLHRHINPHFSNRSRIRLPITLALLTILLYRHNLSVLERMNDRQLPNIQLWGYQNATSSSSSAPAFGIQEKDASTHKMSWLFSPVVDIEALSHTHFRQACMNASLNLHVLQLVSMQEITAIFENALGFTKIALLCKSSHHNHLLLTTNIFH